jgi:hypothetical protein
MRTFQVLLLSLGLGACASDSPQVEPVVRDGGAVDDGTAPVSMVLTWNVKALDNGHVQALAQNDASRTVATLDWDATRDQQDPTVTTVPEYAGREQELGDSPMVLAPEVTKVPWKVGSNHKLGDWLEEISTASDAQLGCLSNL